MQKLSYAVYGLVIGAGLAWWFKPTPAFTQKTAVETKYEVVTQEKIVERPGGIREIVRVVTDKTKKTESSTIEQRKQKDWQVWASAGSRITDFGPQYALGVNRRVLGPIFAGVYGRNDGELGLTISMEF